MVACPMKIGPFRGAHGFLSNMWECPVLYDGITYPSAEHAYQAARYTSNVVRIRIAGLGTPVEAKHFKRDHPEVRPDTPIFNDVKKAIMHDIVRAKFFNNLGLGKCLIETAPHGLVETGWWHDNYWGTCTCNNKDGRHPRCLKPGLYVLGSVLMVVRYLLIATPEDER